MKKQKFKRFVGNEDLFDSSGNKVGWVANYQEVFYSMSKNLELAYRYLSIYHKDKSKYLLATFPYFEEPSIGLFIRDNNDGTISLVSKCAHKMHYTDINYQFAFRTKKQKKFAVIEIARFLDVWGEL